MNLLHNGKKNKDTTLKTYLQFFQHFQKVESVGGIILLLVTASALVIANSPIGENYQHFWRLSLKGITPLVCVNEGLMTLFFVLVGLELKREWVAGELSHRSQILLPAVAAAGGMIVPALVYVFLNYQYPYSLAGWSVPVATDIAFTLGALSLVGKQVAPGLRVFLLALAIFDDIGAILIIALFYVKKFSITYFLYSGVVVLLLWLLKRYCVRSLTIYSIIGLVLWYCILCSGVHPTLAGVIWALFIPASTPTVKHKNLEESLHPWVAYIIMPVFALANAGFSLQGLSGLLSKDNKIAIGIIMGLFLGKPLGVFSFASTLIYLGWSKMPKGANWGQLAGASILCGIGFTMSLFLGTLAFSYQELYMSEVRLGVMLGSLLSGLVGCLVLFLAIRRKTK